MRFGGLPVEDLLPEEALLEEVRRTAGMVRWLQSIIQTWEYSGFSNGATTGLPDMNEVTEFGRTGAVHSSENRVWLEMYREERTHLARASKMCIDAGISERLVRMQESQGEMLGIALERVLGRMQLTAEQKALIPQVVPAVLRELDESGGDGDGPRRLTAV